MGQVSPTMQDVQEAIVKMPLRARLPQSAMAAEAMLQDRVVVVLNEQNLANPSADVNVVRASAVPTQFPDDPKVESVMTMVGEKSPHPLGTLPAAYVVVVEIEGKILHAFHLRFTPPGADPV